MTPRLLLITGDRGAGKSTVCSRLAGRVSRALGRNAVRGVVTRTVAPGRRQVVLYPGEEELLFAVTAAHPNEWSSLQGPRVGPYRISRAAVDQVNRSFSAPSESSVSYHRDARLWILDEVGPLELTGGKGFLPALRALRGIISTAGTGAVAVVVVRPSLITELEARFAPEHVIERMYVTPDNREDLPSRIEPLVLTGTSA
jgi:nucleoside-triphosphatase THEP1